MDSLTSLNWGNFCISWIFPAWIYDVHKSSHFTSLIQDEFFGSMHSRKCRKLHFNVDVRAAFLQASRVVSRFSIFHKLFSVESVREISDKCPLVKIFSCFLCGLLSFLSQHENLLLLSVYAAGYILKWEAWMRNCSPLIISLEHLWIVWIIKHVKSGQTSLHSGHAEGDDIFLSLFTETMQWLNK
jgi:hypothetical protein